MYQHPAAFEFMANSRRDDFLREAQNDRLAREARGTEDHRHTAVQDRLAAVALAVLLAVGLVVVL